jgi:CRP/FNR family transcriptional regulator
VDPRKATIRFAGFTSLSDAELLFLRDLAGPVRRLRRGAFVRCEGDATARLYLLRDGWTASTIDVSGGGRQMIKVHMPGDMLGVPSLALKHAPDTIVALTDISLSTIEVSVIGRLFSESPRLAAMLFLVSQEERVMLMDRLVALGRTSARVRMATLFLQLHARWLRNHPDAGTTFPLPLTRRDFADLAGLTVVHISRIIGQLRQAGILAWESQTVRILDMAALHELAAIPARALQTEHSWMPAAT